MALGAQKPPAFALRLHLAHQQHWIELASMWGTSLRTQCHTIVQSHGLLKSCCNAAVWQPVIEDVSEGVRQHYGLQSTIRGEAPLRLPFTETKGLLDMWTMLQRAIDRVLCACFLGRLSQNTWVRPGMPFPSTLQVQRKEGLSMELRYAFSRSPPCLI